MAETAICVIDDQSPAGRCYNWGEARCRPCEHDDSYYNLLCLQVPECDFGNCFTDNCYNFGLC